MDCKKVNLVTFCYTCKQCFGNQGQKSCLTHLFSATINGIYLQCIENKIYHTFIIYSYYIIGITCIFWNDVTYYLILALLHFRLYVCLCVCCVCAYVFVYVCVFQTVFDKSQFYEIRYLIWSFGLLRRSLCSQSDTVSLLLLNGQVLVWYSIFLKNLYFFFAFKRIFSNCAYHEAPV